MLLTSGSEEFGSRTGVFPAGLRRRMLCPLSYWGTCLSGSIEVGTAGIIPIQPSFALTADKAARASATARSSGRARPSSHAAR